MDERGEGAVYYVCMSMYGNMYNGIERGRLWLGCLADLEESEAKGINVWVGRGQGAVCVCQMCGLEFWGRS